MQEQEWKEEDELGGIRGWWPGGVYSSGDGEKWLVSGCRLVILTELVMHWLWGVRRGGV